MICKYCHTENAPLKKTCGCCGSILEGRAINNVTGEVGYRNADGSFTPDKEHCQNDSIDVNRSIMAGGLLVPSRIVDQLKRLKLFEIVIADLNDRVNRPPDIMIDKEVRISYRILGPFLVNVLLYGTSIFDIPTEGHEIKEITL